MKTDKDMLDYLEQSWNDPFKIKIGRRLGEEAWSVSDGQTSYLFATVREALDKAIGLKESAMSVIAASGKEDVG